MNYICKKNQFRLEIPHLDQVIGFHQSELEHLASQNSHDGIEIVAGPHRQYPPGITGYEINWMRGIKKSLK